MNASNHNPFFYFEGAALLLSLSKYQGDKTLAANAIAKCGIAEVNRQEYVTTLNRLANDGANVTNAAIKILSDTGYTFFLAQHAMYFSQGDCLTYMLLPQNPELYIDQLLYLFKSGDSKSRKSILYTCWFSYTCKGDSLINTTMNDKTIDKEVAKYSEELMGSPALSWEIKQQIEMMDQPKIDELRKESLEGFSDEALDELMISYRMRQELSWLSTRPPGMHTRA